MPQTISRTAMHIMNEAGANVPAIRIENDIARVGSPVMTLTEGVDAWKKAAGALV